MMGGISDQLSEFRVNRVVVFDLFHLHASLIVANDLNFAKLEIFMVLIFANLYNLDSFINYENYVKGTIIQITQPHRGARLNNVFLSTFSFHIVEDFVCF